jgi:peptidyl-dipeptidase Dcp
MRLLTSTHNESILAGAALPAAERQRLIEINQGIATLYKTFSQNLQAEEAAAALVLTRPEDLAGLPESVREILAAAAQEANISALGLILNTRSSVEPFLEYSTRRDLREQVWRAFIRRGDQGNAHDNNATVSAMLRLRTERARLLGYASFAHATIDDSMAKTPDTALRLLESVWPAACERVREEVAQMQQLADDQARREGQPCAPIAPWDYRFYAEKVRQQLFDFDASELRDYLQLDVLRDGMFWLAKTLFGYQFVPVPATQVPRIHPDVQVYEVRDAAGALLGVWYFDPMIRSDKMSNAWMTEYRTQEYTTHRVLPLVCNVENFLPGPAGEPTLLSWEDAKTLFHEFGHGLHGLSSSVQFASLAGVAVSLDFVEFPSQLFESWLAAPEVLKRFARHYQTGVAMPDHLIEKIHRSETFNQGFKTVEYLGSAILDMRLHMTQGEVLDPRAEEARILAELEMPAQVTMRHRTAHFGHLFSEDGYAGGYYSYLWAEVISADAWEAFKERGDVFDPELATRLRDLILRVGNTEDAALLYRQFRGRDPEPAALMRARGFAVKAAGN